MALPPSSPGDAFIREVDDNLRRDRTIDMARAYGKYAVGAMLLVLAAIGGWLYWQDHQAKQAAVDSETLSATLDDVGNGSLATAPQRLQALSTADSAAIRASALFTRAALALRQGDRPAASKIYGSIAGDDKLARPWRDMATVRGVATDYDTLKPDQVIIRLADLAKPGNPFFGSAGEMTATALIAKGDKADAGRMFASMAADRTVPDTIRSRAVAIAGTLGVDASASLPKPAL